jgi:DNA-binding CsgD family transcriptional regulator
MRSAKIGGGALTPRQLDVVALLATGMSNQEIGRRLWISAHTVAGHIASVMAAVGARNRAELVARCYVAGLLPLSWPPEVSMTR